jgi:transcriptional regulator with XRE-family HTH domain
LKNSLVKSYEQCIKLLSFLIYLTNSVKSIFSPVGNFGQKIRELREGKGLLLRQLAASLEIDSGLMSKIERGERKPNREQVKRLAQLLKADKNELLTLWLADKVQYVISEEMSYAEEALEIVKRNIKHDTKTNTD